MPAVRIALTQAAARLPVPTTIKVVESSGPGTLAQALATYQPALLLAALTATDGPP
jgi:hypothetical protein